MSISTEDLEEIPLPARKWAEERLRAYLLGALNEAEEDGIGEALFAYDGLTGQLRDVETELMQEFVDGTLRLDPEKNACLIRRWARPESSAAFALLHAKRELKSPGPVAMDEVPEKVIAFPSRPPSRRWIPVTGAIAAGIVIAVFARELINLKSANEQLAVQLEGARRSASEATTLRAENNRLLRDLTNARADGPSLPKPPNRTSREPGSEAQLAGGDNILRHVISNMDFPINPLKSLYWDIPTAQAEQYDALIKKSNGQSELRPLKASRGKVEIPVDPDDLPFVLSIKNRETGVTPVTNIKVVHESSGRTP